MKPFTPEVVSLPKRTVLTATTIGDPNKMGEVFSALYGAAYSMKFKVFKPKGKKMDVGPVSAFWPDAHLKPKSKWTGIWNLEVSPFVKKTDVIQKVPTYQVKLGTLPAGKYAQVLYVGTYANETKTIKELHAFMTSHKLKIIGDHEEVYLSRPGPKAKTIIRYRVNGRVRA